MDYLEKSDMDEWERIIYHESGHAAMAMWLWQESSYMNLINTTDENRDMVKTAKYGFKPNYNATTPENPRPYNKPGLEQVMVIAAGAMVERIKYGEHSEGCISDFNKAISFIRLVNEEDARTEVDGDYPKSKETTEQIMGLVELIANEAITGFKKQELSDSNFDEVTILSSNDIERIYRSYNHAKNSEEGT